MNSFIALILQSALALLLSVQNNTAASDAQRQQAVMVAEQAIHLAGQALGNSGQDVRSSTSPYSLSPSAGPVGTTFMLTGAFTTCAISAAVNCTQDRFNQPAFFQNGSVMAITQTPPGTPPRTYEVPSSLDPGVYQFGMQNCLGVECTNYPLAEFTVTPR